MTAISLEALGLTEQKVLDAIVDATVNRMLLSVGYDSDNDEFIDDSRVVKNLNALVQKLIDAKVEQLANEHVKPLIESRLESLVLQRTNTWGEKTGNPVTFIEYLIQRADAYMTEPVNFEGKTQGESNGYSWKKDTSRVAFMIDRHLQYSIKSAMEAALKNANSTIAKGLEQAVKLSLAQVQEKLKIQVVK